MTLTITLTSLGQMRPAMASPVPVNQSMMKTVHKCKDFISTLIRIASDQPANTVQNVKDLIQDLIQGLIVSTV